MDVNLNPLLKMLPDMSKNRNLSFLPFLSSHNTQALEFFNKRRYYSFASKQILVIHGTLEKRYFSIWRIIGDVTESDWTEKE